VDYVPPVEEHVGDQLTGLVDDGEDKAVWSGGAMANPSDNDVAVAMEVLAARQAYHDREAAKLLKSYGS
jgi:hypothetical protein